MVVYLDILFFINLIMNYIILIVTSVFGGIYSSRIRIFISAFFGAVYAVVAFFWDFQANFLLKILFGIFMVLVAFGKRNLLRVSALFFMVAFMFAGGIIAIFYLSKNPSYMMLNGIPYIEININLLISTFILCYISLCFAHKGLGKNKIISSNITEIYIKIGDKQAKISTFIDTGNDLHDIITRKPIIIVEADTLRNILPQHMHFILTQKPIDALEFCSGIENNLKIRLVNYKTIGNKNDFMTIFSPDEILDKNGRKIDALIGISLEKINLAGCFAIMGG
ncbi:MAG: sigma-E processing peptidase SpoIIGA [Clostridia bacterium]